MRRGANSPADLEGFLRDESESVLRLARRLVGNGDEAGDLAQDALVQAVRGLASFRGESSLRTWVHRIVVREAVKALRRRRMRQRLLGWLGRADEESAAVDAAQPERLVDARRMAEALGRALARLPARQRVVLTLRYEEELTLPEIAELMEIGPGTVKTHLVRALRAVRSEWQGSEETIDERESLFRDRGEVGDGSAPPRRGARSRENV